jgi:uncharacterized lipoprotein
MSGSMRALVFASLSAALLAACGDSSSGNQDGSADTTRTKLPKGDDLPPEMVAAVPAGKSSNAISVHFALSAAPEVNKPLSVDIAIVPRQDFAAVRARFEGVEALAVTAGDSLTPAASPKINSIIKHQLVLLPRNEGVFMITATVDTDSATEGGVTRVFSVPVMVAGAAPAAPAPAAAAPPPTEKPPAG